MEESKFGFRHIAQKHGGEYTAMSSLIGKNWRDLVGWMIDWTIDDPDNATNLRSDRFCYERRFFLLDGQGHQLFATRTVVLTGKTGVRIMTVFPKYGGGSTYYCTGTVWPQSAINPDAT